MDHIYHDDSRFGPERWFMAMDLYRRIVRHSPPNARFVEVGAFKGRSAAFLAVEMANAGKNLHLVTVDSFPDPDIEGICRRNLAPFGAAVTILKEASPGAARHFADRSLQFVFIDGDHRYDAVRADIQAWAPKVAAGGVLAGDDYWQREPQDDRPALGGPPFPVWMAVESALGRTYDVMVRKGRGIWWKRI